MKHYRSDVNLGITMVFDEATETWDGTIVNFLDMTADEWRVRNGDIRYDWDKNILERVRRNEKARFDVVSTSFGGDGRTHKRPHADGLVHIDGGLHHFQGQKRRSDHMFSPEQYYRAVEMINEIEDEMNRPGGFRDTGIPSGRRTRRCTCTPSRRT